MARTRFKQHDLTRALRAWQAAGLEIASCEIDPDTGRIIIKTPNGASEVANPFDQWKSKHAPRTAQRD